jgi:molecular chaperone IbpA
LKRTRADLFCLPLRPNGAATTAPPAPDWLVTMLLKEDVAMRTFDFSPLFRTTVGFDRLLDRLDSGTRPDWPPYNIEKRGDSQYRISMAIAGFTPDEIELTQQGPMLVVTGQKQAEEARHEFLHQGLALRNFKQTFNLADHVKVVAANLERGLLTVDLVRQVPEELKPRRIEIGGTALAPPRSDTQPKLVEQEMEREEAA